MRELFDRAYEDHTWGGSSPSGPGSSLSYTESIRATLPKLLAALDCKSLLDAPCGDTNWISSVDLSGISYTGYDVSLSLVEMLRLRHQDGRFQHADITSHQLPDVNFWLCRDVLFHLSNSDIYRVLFNLLSSNIEYFGTTHHPQCGINTDCVSSPDSWRPVNLTAEPFYLPSPLYTLWDSAEGFPPRWLGVWSRTQIASWLHRIHGIAASAAAFEISRQNANPITGK